MADIVERLRLMLACDPGCEGRCYDCPTSVASEAADEIERLRAALALGLKVQDAQKAYFKGRTKEALFAWLEIEREFDQMARAALTEAGYG